MQVFTVPITYSYTVFFGFGLEEALEYIQVTYLTTYLPTLLFLDDLVQMWCWLIIVSLRWYI